MQIYIEEYTATPSTNYLQKPVFTCCYQTEQLWLELYNRNLEMVLRSVKSDGADIEKV